MKLINKYENTYRVSFQDDGMWTVESVYHGGGIVGSQFLHTAMSIDDCYYYIISHTTGSVVIEFDIPEVIE